MPKLYIQAVVKKLERNRRLSLGLPVFKDRQHPPYGYKVDPSDSTNLIKDDRLFELLKKAREYLNNDTFTNVSLWLTKYGSPISAMGLNKIMNTRPPYTDDERNRYTSGEYSSPDESGQGQR